MNTSNVGTSLFVVTLAIAGLVGSLVVDTVTSQETHDQIEMYENDCTDRNGELVNSNVIGNHGGLHCELDNGTLLHYHDMNITEAET